jgi:TRAP transporter TAXI family solute receptor
MGVVMKTKKKLLMLFLWFICLILMFPIAQANAERAITRLRVAHGPVQTSSHMVALAMKKLCEDHSAFLRLSLIPTKSWLDDQKLMALGGCELTWASGFQLAWQAQGIKSFKGQQFQDSRLLWATLVVPYNVIVLKGSPIHKIEDLAGKTIVLYPPGSLAHNMTLALLDSLGGMKVNMKHAGTTDMVSGLSDGTYDAITIGIGLGNPGIAELCTTKATRFIPMRDDVYQKLNSAYPDQFIYEKIPKGTYVGVEQDVPTFASTGFLLAHKDVTEDVIYEFCKVWWTHTDEAIAIHKKACGDASRKDYATYTAAVPRHPGALRYFKEAGILK